MSIVQTVFFVLACTYFVISLTKKSREEENNYLLTSIICTQAVVMIELLGKG